MFAFAIAVVAGCESKLGEPVNVQNDLRQRSLRCDQQVRQSQNSLVLSTIGVTPFYNFTVPAIPLIPAILYDLYRATTILTQPSEDGWIIGVA